MRLWVRCLVVLLVVSAFAGCLSSTTPDPADGGGEPAGETLRFTHVRGPDEAVAAIEEVARHPGVAARVVGESVEGRPIHLVTMGEGPFVFWVMGRLHGNEPSGMEAILLLMELLAAPAAALPEDAPAVLHDLRAHRELLLERLTFVFVPVGNPDGAAAFQRGNAAGVDLNRDFFAFGQPESQAVRDAWWEHRPDACLDLHNIGPSENDFEAYGPTGPLFEGVVEALLLRDSWFAVHEVDAQGGRASGMNEDYRAPEPAEEYPWPEAYHPGTHDFFCSARGAPGWTPEGSIPSGGDNGATDPGFAWSARLHAVTVAASAFHWAGVYDDAVPYVFKGSLTEADTYTFAVNVSEEQAGNRLLLQAVWRPLVSYGDHSLLPVDVRFRGPDGVIESRAPAPYQWGSTVVVESAAAGTYRIEVASLVPVEQQSRGWLWDARDPLVTVARDGAALRLAAAAGAPGPVHVALTDVGDRGAWDAAAFSVAPHALREVDSPLQERDVVEWRLVLQPGEALAVEAAGRTGGEPGPFRFTAESGERLFMGVATEPRVNEHG